EVGPHNGHGFCATCGVRMFSSGDIPELGGAFVTVSIAVLEDATEAELIAAPVIWCDGLNDNWWSPPAEVRHL
ncbi:MAG: GFA family protein, partial [Pararhodobacter sp.]